MCERRANILYKTMFCVTKCKHCKDRHFRSYFLENQTFRTNPSQQSQSTNSPQFTQSRRLNTVLGGCTLHFGLKYELITNLMQLNIYLCTFSSTCFGLIRPSSGAMDVTISYICSIWCPWCS